MPETSPDRAGRVVSALACEGRVRVLVAVMDGPAISLARRHHLGPSAARLGAEGLVAAALLSSQLKGEERHTINIYGEEPAFELMIDLWAEGPLRARMSPADLAPVTWFRGIMAVLKFLGNKELYRGIAPIEDETIESALQRYFTQSVQSDGRVRILAELDPQGQPTFAAGILVERLPDMDPEEFAALFDKPLQTDFRTQMTNFAFGQLAGGPVEVLDHRDYAYQCPCSRERILDMLQGLGPQEIQGILSDPGHAEVTCHFCNTTYRIDAPTLRALLPETPKETLKETPQ